MTSSNFKEIFSIVPDLIQLLDPVIKSLGPNGRTVFINNFSTTLTKDGSTILKSISCENIYTYTILNFIKDNISNLSVAIGDGTTSTVLIIVELLKNIIEIINEYPIQDIIIGLQISLDYINGLFPYLSKSITIENKKFLIDLGTIATNGNKFLGTLLTETIGNVGNDGIVNIEKIYNWNPEIFCSYQKGCSLDVGYSNPYFTYVNNQHKTKISLENCYILLSKKNFNILTEPLEYILNLAIKEKKSLVILAPAIEGDFLKNLMIAHNRNLLHCISIKFPYNYEGFVDDIRIITGSKWWDHQLLDANDSYESYLGQSPLVEVTKSQTIIHSFQQQNIIDNHINYLKDLNYEMEQRNIHNSYEKIILNQRIAKLTGGIACINIGGSNEAEKDEIKDRLTDGLYCIKSSLKEGISLGGGITWFLLGKFLKEAIDNNTIPFNNDGHRQGALILSKSLNILLKTIINNGFNIDKNIFNSIDDFYKDIHLNTIENKIKNQEYLLGFNGKNSQLCNLWEDGIINSTGVEKSSLNIGTQLVINIINSSFIINPNN